MPRVHAVGFNAQVARISGDENRGNPRRRLQRRHSTQPGWLRITNYNVQYIRSCTHRATVHCRCCIAYDSTAEAHKLWPTQRSRKGVFGTINFE